MGIQSHVLLSFPQSDQILYALRMTRVWEILLFVCLLFSLHILLISFSPEEDTDDCVCMCVCVCRKLTGKERKAHH